MAAKHCRGPRRKRGLSLFELVVVEDATIDANIAAAQRDVDVGSALLGRHLVVVRGSDACPAMTAQQQP